MFFSLPYCCQRDADVFFVAILLAIQTQFSSDNSSGFDSAGWVVEWYEKRNYHVPIFKFKSSKLQ